MKANTLRKFTVLTLGFMALSIAFGDAFVLVSGETCDGSIYKILDGKVTLRDAAGEKREYALNAFKGTSRKAIRSWAAENQDCVDVYTRWDAMPVIKSSVMPRLPEQFHDSAFKGMVSVDLVLDDEGRVIFAKIKKSTHEELEAPSLEAAKTWLFEPAKIGGKPVKSKLRVPFKFVYVEKPKPEPAA